MLIDFSGKFHQMPTVLAILLAAFFTITVSHALGGLLLKGLSPRLHRLEEDLLGFVAGSALLSSLIFILCATGHAGAGTFFLMGAAIIAAAIWRNAYRRAESSLPGSSPFRSWLFGVIFCAFLLLYLLNAMAPEFSPDGRTYHLSLVSRYLREHGFNQITTNNHASYANLPQGLEMLFLFAFAFGRHSAAALVHLAFLVALPLLMTCYARRFGLGYAGCRAALFVFLSPIAGVDGTSAYNDVALACVAFSLFYLLQFWAGTRHPAWLVPIGLLAGFCYSVKYTGFVAVPYTVIFVVWKLYRTRESILRPLLILGVCASFMILPWIAKNWYLAGNPVSPFLNELFPNPYVHVGLEKQYRTLMRDYHTYGLNSFWEVPLQLTVKGWLGGILGPVFLLAPLGLLVLRQTAGRRLLLASLVFGVTYTVNLGARFLIPALPFVSLAMALVLARTSRVAQLLVVAHGLASWPAVRQIYAPGIWALSGMPLAAALRIVPEETFLRAGAPEYEMALLIERVVPASGRVLTFVDIPQAYTSREVLVRFWSASNQVAEDILSVAGRPEEAPAAQFRFGFSATAVRKIRLLQLAAESPCYWTINEIRVFRGQSELGGRSAWSLRADPNPWDVRMAFDDNFVTRWRSWQNVRPGMFIEVDFGGTEVIDSVLLECPRDDCPVQVRLDGRMASGEWRSLADAAEPVPGPPLSGLRRAATRELKSRGIGYVLFPDGDPIGNDFEANQTAWGVKAVARAANITLYEIGDSR